MFKIKLSFTPTVSSNNIIVKEFLDTVVNVSREMLWLVKYHHVGLSKVVILLF